MISYLLVVLGIFLSAAAQVVLKISAVSEVKDLRWFILLCSSILFYGFAFLIYAIVLKYFPISKVAPIMTIGTVVLVTISGVIIGESLAMGQIVGLILGAVSILLILS